MKEFLNNITFNKEIHIREPKEEEKKEKPVKSKKAQRIYRRLMQLVFFIIVVIILWTMMKYGALHTVSFIKGHEYQTWEHIKEDFNESAKKGHY